MFKNLDLKLQIFTISYFLLLINVCVCVYFYISFFFCIQNITNLSFFFWLQRKRHFFDIIIHFCFVLFGFPVKFDDDVSHQQEWDLKHRGSSDHVLFNTLPFNIHTYIHINNNFFTWINDWLLSLPPYGLFRRACPASCLAKMTERPNNTKSLLIDWIYVWLKYTS